MSVSMEATKLAVPNFHHLSNGTNENSSYQLTIEKNGQNQTVDFFKTFYPTEEATNGEGLHYQKIYPGAQHNEPLKEEEFSAVCYLIENSVKFKVQEIAEMHNPNYFQTINIYLVDSPRLEDEPRPLSNLFIDVSIIVSIISLIILISVFFVTQETKHLHGKSVVCQCISFMISLIVIAINCFDLIQTRGFLCQFIGKLYLHLSAFF